MYQGSLFRKSFRYCQLKGFDKIYILSAKYGLLQPDQTIHPYEETLLTKSKTERRQWASKVTSQLKALGEDIDDHRNHWYFAGSKYVEFFRGHLPLDGKPLGKCLQWLTDKINNLQPHRRKQPWQKQ